MPHRVRRSSLLLAMLAARPVLAQAPRPGHTAHPTEAGTAAADARQALPIRRVSLYKNGVGFFEHIGTVHGDEAVRIDFTTAQLNDVLQTLTAVDLGGGRIAGADYNSTTPLDQQLKNLPLALSADPTSDDLYSAVRGTRVEVTGAGAPITGRILNVELRDTVKAEANDGTVAQRHFLTVVADSGTIRTVELTGNTSVRLLEPGPRNDVGRYLETLSANHGDGLRHLTLLDKGTAAPRELRVSYISEVPVWKCTYRLLFDGAKTAGTLPKTATLQGWAVIDNTVGTDWNNVQLSLVAGAPQSFLQPISQPYYSRRPEIGLPQEAQLTPQTHESGEGEQASVAVGYGEGKGTGNGLGPGASGGISGQAVFSSGLNTAPIVQNRVFKGVDAMHGNLQMPANARATGPAAAPAPIAYEDSASASIAPQTTTGSFDDNFEYNLTDPVTIRKNESALVPILQARVEVDPVTLWSPTQPRPLRAMWLKNTSALTLDRGSFSVVEGGNFSGQGLLDAIHPGERRLLSYAADEAVRVSTDYAHDTRRLQQITIARGILEEKTSEVAEVEYLVHNAAPDARTVVVEQPRRPGWTLDSEPKPEETTATLFRFRVATAPGETVRLHVGQRHTLQTRYALASTDEAQLTVLLRQNGDPATVVAALQPVFDAKRRVAGLDNQIAARNDEITTITNDQTRLRQNLAALKGTAEERALTRRYTAQLNAQEDRLAALNTELKALNDQLTAAQNTLTQAIESLSLDQNLGA